MNALQALNALNEIAKRCVVMEVDPEVMEVGTFTSHGDKSVMRARGFVKGVLITLDVYVD